MVLPKRPGVDCNHPGCGERIVFAYRAGTSRGKKIPLEARDRTPGTDDAVGSLIVVDGTAWRLADLTEHFMARFEVSEPRARELALDYPHHRPHFHEPATTTPKESL